MGKKRPFKTMPYPYRKKFRNTSPAPKFMASLYAGVCAQTGQPFKAGDQIAWCPENRLTFCESSEVYKGALEVLRACSSYAGQAQSPHLIAATLETQIKHFVNSGAEIHRPERADRSDRAPRRHPEARRSYRGKCEDAPCCGCCD
jgi:hypothetical protein